MGLFLPTVPPQKKQEHTFSLFCLFFFFFFFDVRRRATMEEEYLQVDGEVFWSKFKTRTDPDVLSRALTGLYFFDFLFFSVLLFFRKLAILISLSFLLFCVRSELAEELVEEDDETELKLGKSMDVVLDNFEEEYAKVKGKDVNQSVPFKLSFIAPVKPVIKPITKSKHKLPIPQRMPPPPPYSVSPLPSPPNLITSPQQPVSGLPSPMKGGTTEPKAVGLTKRGTIVIRNRADAVSVGSGPPWANPQKEGELSRLIGGKWVPHYFIIKNNRMFQFESKPVGGEVGVILNSQFFLIFLIFCYF
jgi:hypothetical protein